MRNLFGYSIVKAKDLDRLSNLVSEIIKQNRATIDYCEHLMEIVNTNAATMNKNFNDQNEMINRLIKLINDLQDKTFITIKNN